MKTFYVSNPEHLYSFSSNELKQMKKDVIEKSKDNDVITIRLQGRFTQPSIYGIFGMCNEEYKNYRRGGGVWCYYPPYHYLQIINAALEKVLKFEDDARYFEEEGVL